MKPRDLRELLGGYASGTLTAQEREALFQAALEDQALFDALADEEALREVLADPIARAQLVRDLAPAQPGFWHSLSRWIRMPATLGFVGAAAALVMVVGVVRYAGREAAAPKLVAQAPRPPEALPAAPAVKAPVGRPTRLAPPAPAPQKPFEAPPARMEAEQAATVAKSAVELPQPPPASTAAGVARPAEVAPPPVAAEPLRADALRTSALPPSPPPLTYSVLVQDAAGAWRETSPTTAFRLGDHVRLRVRSAQDGYVEVTARDGSVVTPLSDPGGNPVMRGQELLLPSAGALELSGVSGEKLLRMSFSASPLAAPGVGMQFARGAGAAVRKSKAEAPPPVPPASIDLRLTYRPK